MSTFKRMESSDGTIVNVCVEDGKKFAAHAFMILTTDIKGNVSIVTPVNQKNEVTFFVSSIKPREDCKTLAKLAILRLRENSKNLFSLEESFLNLYLDVPTHCGLMCRIYFLKIPCVHRSIFNKNKEIIDAATGHFDVSSEWTKNNTLTLLPLNLINFDMLGDYLMDVDGKKIVSRLIHRHFLEYSKKMILKMCANPGIILPCSVRVHVSKSWTNGTTCYYHKV